MFRFVGKYGEKSSVFKNKTLYWNFISVFEDDHLAIYSDEKELTSFYFSQYDVHLVMDGIVIGNKCDNGTTAVGCPEAKTRLKWVHGQYLKYGKRTLEDLDGSFSALLWDGRNRCLHICRDDGGAKLIYYYSDGSGLYFSNSLELLAKIYGKPSISSDALNEYLRFLDISEPYTIYDNIFLLDSDKILSAEGSCFQLADKNSKTQPDVEISNERLDINLKNFKLLFIESIRRRIEMSGHVGAFLSGGIDSSLVCAVAASIRKDITAFTVGFQDPRFDESPIAQKIAGHLGIQHEVLKFTPDQDFEAFLEFTCLTPSPFADPAIIPTFQCFKHVGPLKNLMLDGTGADTLIGVMPARHVRFILDYSRHVPTKMRFLISKLLSCHKKTAKKIDLFDYQDATQILIRWKGWSSDEITALRGRGCDLTHTMFYQIYRNNPDKTPFELYSMLMGALPDDRIHFSSSTFGPDVAFPFFDRNVRTYVKNLPMQHRYANGRKKVLFRALLGEYVPQEIWDVPKQGFNFPFADLLRFNQCELIHTYLSDRSLAKHGFFNKLTLAPYVDRFLKGDSQVDFKIWALVVFQAWYENFYEKL